MSRKPLAGLVIVLALAAGACTTKNGDVNTADAPATTAPQSETTTTQSSGLTGKINLGGLEETNSSSSSGGTSSGGLTDAQISCIDDATAADPSFNGITSIDQITDQAQLEVFWTYVLGCTGPEPLIDQFMKGVASSDAASQFDLTCIRGQVEALSADEGVKLLSGDAAVTAQLQSDIVANCSL